MRPAAPSCGDQRPAMATDIGKGPYLPVIAMNQDDWLGTDLEGHEISRLRQFFDAPDTDPFAGKQVALLQRQNRRIDVEIARHRPGLVIGPLAIVAESFTQ